MSSSQIHRVLSQKEMGVGLNLVPSVQSRPIIVSVSIAYLQNQNHISTSLIGKMSFWHKGSARELLVIYKRKNSYQERSHANIDCTLAKYPSLAMKSFVGKSLIPSFN